MIERLEMKGVLRCLFYSRRRGEQRDARCGDGGGRNHITHHTLSLRGLVCAVMRSNSSCSFTLRYTRLNSAATFVCNLRNASPAWSSIGRSPSMLSARWIRAKQMTSLTLCCHGGRAICRRSGCRDDRRTFRTGRRRQSVHDSEYHARKVTQHACSYLGGDEPGRWQRRMVAIERPTSLGLSVQACMLGCSHKPSQHISNPQGDIADN